MRRKATKANARGLVESPIAGHRITQPAAEAIRRHFNRNGFLHTASPIDGFRYWKCGTWERAAWFEGAGAGPSPRDMRFRILYSTARRIGLVADLDGDRFVGYRLSHEPKFPGTKDTWEPGRARHELKSRR